MPVTVWMFAKLTIMCGILPIKIFLTLSAVKIAYKIDNSGVVGPAVWAYFWDKFNSKKNEDYEKRI